MRENGFWKRWVYWFSFAVAVILVYKTLDSFSEIADWFSSLLRIIMPFLLGVLIAYLFYIPCRGVEKIYRKSKIDFIYKKSRTIAVFTVYLIALLIIVIITNFVIPAVSTSLLELANNLPNYYKNIIEFLEMQPEDSIWNKVDSIQIIKSLEQINVKDLFSTDSVVNYIKGAIGVVNTLFAVFVTIIVSIYVLIERGEILRFVKNLSEAVFTKKTYENLGKYFAKSNEIFFKFISSQIFDGFIVGIILSIAMSIMGVKYAILLGFMIGVFNIIPYFGPIVAIGIAILITVFTGGFGQAVWMGLISIILQQIDANIINPKIVGSSLVLSPILIIFAVTVGGAYFGVLGMFLAVPVITIIKILVTDYIEYRKKLKTEDI